MITTDIYYKDIDTQKQSSFQKRLQKKINILNKSLKDIHYPMDLKTRVYSLNNTEYKISFDLLLPNKKIFVEKKSDDLLKTLEIAFNSLKENSLQAVNQLTQDQQKTFKRDTQKLNELHQELQQAKQTNKKEEFNQRLIPLISNLKRYISRRIRFAIISGIIQRNSVSPKDLVEDVIELAYTDFTTKPNHMTLENWLYNLADQALTKKLQEREFESQHLESLEQLIDQEIDSINQPIVMDAEGELYLENEFPEEEGIVHDYSYQTIPNVQPVKLKPTADKSKQLKKILRILRTLPEEKRSIYDLYAVDAFTAEEIATIKNKKAQHIKQTIDEVSQYIVNKL